MNNKITYITTSIPYANGAPHLGHSLEYIYTDILARFLRLSKKEILFSTGLDEHGSKIEENAKAQKLDSKDYVDDIARQFSELLKTLDISNDRFIRTTDKDHQRRVQLIWKKILENKDIYRAKYEGWYCVGDEAFFSETEVKNHNGICPNHNRPFEKITEENYFFKLSKFAPKIKQAIENGEFRVIPTTRKNEILSLINQGLDDISISRPKSSVSWGIAVPGDSEQVMYVWFEALLNYLTVIGYPEDSEFKKYWPADYQVIGKDILRFHAAIWPALLYSLDLKLPTVLYVHGFIQIEGKKMGKSLGNGVSHKELTDKYGSDALRYYIARHIPSYEDGDFTLEALKNSYNNELANELGNAVQRTASMIERFLGGRLDDIPPSEHDIAAYGEFMTDCRFDRALDEVWIQVRGINQYIDDTRPWELAKNKDLDHLEEVLANAVSEILEVAILLDPFMPKSSKVIKQIFHSDAIIAPKTPLFVKHEV